MSWVLGWDEQHQRDIGYGVPAFCDHPGCGEEINRGLGYRCEDENCGCSKFYCLTHRYARHTHDAPPSRVHPLWRNHLLTDNSWRLWRLANPERVAVLRAEVDLGEPPSCQLAVR